MSVQIKELKKVATNNDVKLVSSVLASTLYNASKSNADSVTAIGASDGKGWFLASQMGVGNYTVRLQVWVAESLDTVDVYVGKRLLETCTKDTIQRVEKSRTAYRRSKGFDESKVRFKGHTALTDAEKWLSKFKLKAVTKKSVTPKKETKTA